jgi:Flp pilus assembly secretin CpaC
MNLLTKFGTATAAVLFICASAHAGQFTVESGKTKPLRLKGEAASVVLGNPNIADVAVHDGQLLFISGKVFGTTNLIIFNEDGQAIYTGDIVVTTNTANMVTVQRGSENYTYDCAPDCRPTLTIGDAPAQFDAVYNQMTQAKELSE